MVLKMPGALLLVTERLHQLSVPCANMASARILPGAAAASAGRPGLAGTFASAVLTTPATLGTVSLMALAPPIGLPNVSDAAVNFWSLIPMELLAHRQNRRRGAAPRAHPRRRRQRLYPAENGEERAASFPPRSPCRLVLAWDRRRTTPGDCCTVWASSWASSRRPAAYPDGIRPMRRRCDCRKCMRARRCCWTRSPPARRCGCVRRRGCGRSEARNRRAGQR